MVILYVAVTLVALMIIGLVLIQQSKGGGLGASFGGGGDSVFGAQAGSHLTKLTVILVSVFFFLVLLLAIMSGRSSESGNLITDEPVAGEVKTESVEKVEDKVAEKAESVAAEVAGSEAKADEAKEAAAK